MAADVITTKEYVDPSASWSHVTSPKPNADLASTATAHSICQSRGRGMHTSWSTLKTVAAKLGAVMSRSRIVGHLTAGTAACGPAGTPACPAQVLNSRMSQTAVPLDHVAERKSHRRMHRVKRACIMHHDSRGDGVCRSRH